ncbi:MAG: exodeoxyribonuclease III [Thermodesulfobacteriota bacterium]
MAFPLEKALSLVQETVAGLAVPVVDLIAVQTRDPFKVLVATILSARTRDEVTAKAAGRLFKRADDLAALAALSEEEIARLVRPVGFFNSKARHLAALPGAVDHLFGGRIPDTVEELVQLPGVGRKTANLVVAVAFGKPAICVDTHVHRIVNIWGYVRTRTPLETEMALRATLPPRYWIPINSLLVAFGQSLCRPVAPHCDRCPLESFCPKIGVTPRKRPAAKGTTSMRLISWNVNGLRAIAGKGFLDLLRDLDADIIALQEIKAQPEQLPEEILRPDGYKSFWHPAEKKGYAGVCVYTRREPLTVTVGLGIEEHDREGRVLTLEFPDCFLVNVYFPNAQHGLTRLDYKLRFNDDLLAYLDLLRQKKTVAVCGDYNVAHKEIDLANPKANVKNPGFTPEERAWMDRFLAGGWLDTFRMFHPEPEQYTWWSYRANARARNIGWRIDYFCVDEKSRGRVKDAAILAEVTGSDHCPVSLVLDCG